MQQQGANMMNVAMMQQHQQQQHMQAGRVPYNVTNQQQQGPQQQPQGIVVPVPPQVYILMYICIP
jgi:hypothetical protein